MVSRFRRCDLSNAFLSWGDDGMGASTRLVVREWDPLPDTNLAWVPVQRDGRARDAEPEWVRSEMINDVVPATRPRTCDESAGYWGRAPVGAGERATRRYTEGTLVLETGWLTDGTARVFDFMPPRQANPQLVRIVVGMGGHVKPRSVLRPRFDYGRVNAIAGPDCVRLTSAVEFDRTGPVRSSSRCTTGRGLEDTGHVEEQPSLGLSLPKRG